MAQLCKLCSASESRYKCPTCLIPYCSLTCYKPHKEAHTANGDQPPQTQTYPLPIPPGSTSTTTATTTTSATGATIANPTSALEPSSAAAEAEEENDSLSLLLSSLSSPPPPSKQEQGQGRKQTPTPTTATVTPPPSKFTPLLTNPHLPSLLKSNPSLQSHLWSIYTATLEPAEPQTHQNHHHQHRGRNNNNQIKPWTEEIGIKRGLKRLGHLRSQGLNSNGGGGALREDEKGTLEMFVDVVLEAVGEREAVVVGS